MTAKRSYFVLEKYETTILGFQTHIYIMRLNTNYYCKQNCTIKRGKDFVKKCVMDNLYLFKLLTLNKVSATKLYKNDPNLMKQIKKIMDPSYVYTYCLNKNTLIFAETTSPHHKSYIKNWLSKHVMLCDNSACASGEAVIHNNRFVFDNMSGTFTPHLSKLYILKKILPTIKIVNWDSPIRDKIFKNY